MPLTPNIGSQTNRGRSRSLLRVLSSLLLSSGLLIGGCDETTSSQEPTGANSAGSGAPSTAVPVFDDERLNVGNKLLLEGRLQEASMIFDAVVKQHPGMGRANFYKGLVLHQSQAHAGALGWYKAALDSGHNFPERDTLPYYMAWSYYYADQPILARESIERYLAADPGRADAHFLAGIIALEGGRLAEAETELTRAIEIGKGDPDAERSMARAWIRLADLRTETGDYAGALEAADKAVALRPELSEAWFRKYTILVRLGEDDQADYAREQWKSLSSQEAGRAPGS